MRKTKIIATLGPASFNQETISGLMDNGMDVALSAEIKKGKEVERNTEI